MVNIDSVRFGNCVSFQSHDRGQAVGVVLGQTFPHAIDGEREYTVLYRGPDGAPVHDSLVAECWVRPCSGWVDPLDCESLQAVIRNLVKKHVREVEVPVDEFVT